METEYKTDKTLHATSLQQGPPTTVFNRGTDPDKVVNAYIVKPLKNAIDDPTLISTVIVRWLVLFCSHVSLSVSELNLLVSNMNICKQRTINNLFYI